MDVLNIMKEFIAGERKDLKEIQPNATSIAVTFRPGINDILDIVENGRRIKTIKVSKSIYPSIGAIQTRVANSHGIEIIANDENMRGKRTDINGKTKTSKKQTEDA